LTDRLELTFENLQIIWKGVPYQGDHLYRKPGNIREFDNGRENVRELTKGKGNFRKSVREHLAVGKTDY